MYAGHNENAKFWPSILQWSEKPERKTENGGYSDCVCRWLTGFPQAVVDAITRRQQY
jgi:hypothetical protein